MARAKRHTPPEGPRHKGWVGRTHTRNFLAPHGRSEIEPWYWSSRGALEKAALAWELDGGGPVQLFRATATRMCQNPGAQALLAGCALSEPALDPIENATRARAEKAAKAGAEKAAKAEMRRSARIAKAREKARVREEKARAREEKRARRGPPRPPPLNPSRRAPPKGPRKAGVRPARDDAPSARGLLPDVKPPVGWSLPIGARASSELPAIPAAAAREALIARYASEMHAAGMVVIEYRRGAVSRWTRTGEVAWAADRRLVALDVSHAADTPPQVVTNMTQRWEVYTAHAARAVRVGVVALDRVEHRATQGAPITPDAWDALAYLAPADGSRVITVNAVTLRALLDATLDPPEVRVFEGECLVLLDGRVAAVLATRGDAWTRKGSRKRKGR